MNSNIEKVLTVELDFVKLNYTASSNLLELEYNSNVIIELDHAILLVENILSLTNGFSVLSLITSSDGFVSMDTEAKHYIASAQREHKYCVASAFVTTVLANRIAARFFIKFCRPPQPCKIFKNREGALSWLYELENKKLNH
tara:strand:+ start:1024 stop:1449 length:426 start_codon:yes stop_codon:yes gene_type:complete